MRRKIPATMASQHPDHANKPYWHHKEFITAQHEHKECYLMYSDLGIEEYKWDWEGKIVDESIMERLMQKYYDYFRDNQIGRDKFLTFRLPNPKAETEFRLVRAFTGLLSAAALTKQVGLHSPPLFEVILPMTESAKEMIAIQEAFAEIADLKHELHRFDTNTLKQIEVIPLFEQVLTIINSKQILETYIEMYKQQFGGKPEYLRPYVARSDPSLNSGLVPTVLAIKIALSDYKKFSDETGIETYPIIGSASLPFRGGLTPFTVDQFIDEYRGIRTALIQSAFRYDYDIEAVKSAIHTINSTLESQQARNVNGKERQEIIEMIPIFESGYRQVIEELAAVINKVASYLPPRRERVQHIGLFGYTRGVGKVTLPRAISFTAALYSIGLPPELIGTGRGLKQAMKTGQIKTLEKFYIHLKEELGRAGRFVNKKLLKKIAKEFPAVNLVLEDIKVIEEYLGHELGPENKEETEHAKLAEQIYEGYLQGKIDKDLLTRAARLRRSMG